MVVCKRVIRTFCQRVMMTQDRASSLNQSCVGLVKRFLTSGRANSDIFWRLGIAFFGICLLEITRNVVRLVCWRSADVRKRCREHPPRTMAARESSSARCARASSPQETATKLACLHRAAVYIQSPTELSDAEITDLLVIPDIDGEPLLTRLK